MLWNKREVNHLQTSIEDLTTEGVAGEAILLEEEGMGHAGEMMSRPIDMGQRISGKVRERGTVSRP
jgi:hypothetical protein